MTRQHLYNRSFHDGLGIKYVAQTILIVVLVAGVNDSFSLGINTKSDSLRALLLVATDTTKVNLLNALGKQFWMSQPDTARLYTFDALHASKKINYRKGEAEALRIIGWSYHYEGNEVQAKAYVTKAISIFEQIGNEQGLAAALNNLGAICSRMGDYAEGLQALERSLAIFQRVGNQEAIGSVLNYIGINYQNQGNYDKAIEYCLQGLQIRRKINDHPGIAFSLINMGNMYLAADKLTTALDYYQAKFSPCSREGIAFVGIFPASTWRNIPPAGSI